MNVLNILGLLGIMNGIAFFLHSVRTKLMICFYPAVTTGIIVLTVYLGGLIRSMRGAFIILYGLAFLGYVLIICKGLHKVKRDVSGSNKYLIIFTISFCLVSFFFAIVMKGRFLFTYDDFSHWGVVTRIVSTNQRFPISEDGILFNSYPLGSSCFISFCCSILGNSADSYLFSQSLMLLSFGSTLFSLVETESATKPTIIRHLGIVLLFGLLVLYNVSVETLCVDNLLALSCVATIMIAYRNNSAEMTAELIILLCCVISIKNSGVFLAIAVSLYFVFSQTNQKRWKKNYLVIILPIAFFILWRIHVTNTFSTIGKHDLSIKNYSNIFTDNKEKIDSIIKIILPIVINPIRNHALPILIVFSFLYFFIPKVKRKQCRRKWLFLVALVIGYEIGILATYTFSMPISETLWQNGRDYTRYNGTLVAISAALLVDFIYHYDLRYCNDTKIKRQIICFISYTMTVVILCLNVKPIKLKETRMKSSSDAFSLSQIVSKKEMDRNASYYVCFQNPDVAGYNTWCARFYLGDNVSVYSDVKTAKEKWAENKGESYFVNLYDSTIENPTDANNR